MTKIRTMLYGLYPRSEALRISISKWERKGITDQELSVTIQKEKNDLLSQFRSNHIWTYTDPLSNWNDVLRGVTSVLTGLSLGRLARYKETNTFYREPNLSGYPEFTGKVANPDHDTHLPGDLFTGSGDGYAHFLPGIDSFLNMSIIGRDLNADKLADSLLTAYRGIIRSYGIKNLVIFEPYPNHTVSSVYEEIFASVPTHYVVDDFPRDYFGKIREKPLSVTVRNIDRFRDLAEVTDSPGVPLFDAQNTRVEDPEVLRNRILSLAEPTGASNVILTHTEYLDFLPRVIADRKAASIGMAGDAS